MDSNMKGLAFALPQPEPQKTEEEKQQITRMACISMAINANVPIDDEAFDPFNSVKLAQAFLDIVENGTTSIARTGVANIKPI